MVLAGAKSVIHHDAEQGPHEIVEHGRIGPPVSQLEALDIDGTVTLYHPALDQALVLNGTASDVWRLCDGEHSFDEVVAFLADAYGTDARSIRAEVRAVVERFEGLGLLAQHSS